MYIHYFINRHLFVFLHCSAGYRPQSLCYRNITKTFGTLAFRKYFCDTQIIISLNK